MSNKFTPMLDAVEYTDTSVGFFDAIFGTWGSSPNQNEKWDFLANKEMTREAETEVKQLFWCFIAELSDQDLQECFPELFSDMYP